MTVHCHRGRPPLQARLGTEVDVGASPPSAFTGLRRVLRALESEVAGAVERSAARHPVEWAELFPDNHAGAPTRALRDIAGLPSPRALDGESEVAFRVLQAAADALVSAVAELDRPLVLRNGGAADLVSLRGVMRAVERSRAAGMAGVLVCAEWDAPTGDRRVQMLGRLRERMGATLEGDGDPAVAACDGRDPDGAEGRHLRAAVDPELGPDERLTAAVLAARACFVSTNHEGALLACHSALRLLEGRPDVAPEDLARAFAGMGSPDVDAAAVPGSAADLQALLWRSTGIAHSFLGEADAAVEAFRRGLGAGPSPLAEAAVRESLGRQLALAESDAAAAELRRGVVLVEADDRPEAAIAEGWLRVALALDAVRRRRLREASEELVRALRRVGDRQDAAATHLRLDVIAGISALHETAHRHPDALRMWHRYLEASPDWSDRFVEHYAYREGGLHLAAGEADGILCHRQAFRRAAALGDAFHGAATAAELGGHHLAAGRDAEALPWYAEAIDLGRQSGDPHRIGVAMAGAALAGGECDPAAAAAILRLANTGAQRARALAQAIEAGDRDAQRAMLPLPRTTLRRPFDLVSL
jgi:tetratricopeptide (TPR) repeat protein